MPPDPDAAGLILPVDPAGVTAAWLGTALAQKCPGVEVLHAEVRDVIPGTSTKIRVALRYNDAGQASGLPPTLIVKGGFEAHSSSMAPMYLNEMRFYRDVAPRLPINVPRCFFAGSDPASHQSIVIMEDLAARGVQFLRPQQPSSYARVEAFLDAIARFHAHGWNSPALDDDGAFGWVREPFGHWSRVYQQRYLQPEVWAHYMAQPRAAAVSVSLHDRERMAAALDALARLNQSADKVLAHGDLHLGNLYVEADGTPGFLDAQIARSSWCQDVAYHMIAALDIGDRRRWEQALLSYYLQRLAYHGVSAPPGFDAAWRAYRAQVAYGLFIFLINETRFQTEAANTAYAARFGAAAVDHGTFALLLD